MSRSYRDELRRRLRSALEQRNAGQEGSGQRLNKLGQREKAIEDALVDTETLTRSRALIREFLEQNLKSVQSNAESEAADAAQSFSEREAFAAALEALDQLENVAIELERAEARLLQAKNAAAGEAFAINSKAVDVGMCRRGDAPRPSRRRGPPPRRPGPAAYKARLFLAVRRIRRTRRICAAFSIT